MILIIALKHTALGFCLCQQEFTTAGSGCDCAQEEAAAEASCGCCPDESNDNSAPVPCDDCMVEVSVDPGDYLWSSKAFEPTDEIGIPLALPIDREALHAGKRSVPRTLAPARGSPPGSPPLYIWTRVLRL